MGYSPWGHKESDMAERLTNTIQVHIEDNKHQVSYCWRREENHRKEQDQNEPQDSELKLEVLI